MLRPRIIPCLLLSNDLVVKTTNFSNPKYVGDPINAVKIFNDKLVDEIIVIDIDSSSQKKEPNFKLIEKIARECRMPLCYAGGIKSIENAKKLVGLGAEKVGISSYAISNPSFLTKLSLSIGSQSIVVILDIKKHGFKKNYKLFINNGKVLVNEDPFEFIKKLNNLGIGEILINSIDCDGNMSGYDLNLVQKVRNITNLPTTILGGAGHLSDIEDLILRHKIIGAAAGSLFIFKGKYKAVLINYPSQIEKESLFTRVLS